MIREALNGLGLKAYGDPLPGAGVYGTLSTGSRSFGHGDIRLVSSSGRARSATYREIYLFNPWVFAAANMSSGSIGRMPLHVYGYDADGNKQIFRSELPQTPGRPSAGFGLDRLLKFPTNGISRPAFIGNTLRERKIFGNALWKIVRDQGGGLPTGLTPISWLNVDRVEEDGYGNPLWYDISPRGQVGQRERLYPQDVIHFGCGSESAQATGISVLESCHHTLALHEALMRHLLAYLENSARGSGYFKVDNDQQAKKARQMITELYTSPENAGKVLVTSGEWKSMSDTPEHSSIVELIQESRVEVLAAFKTPPPILGLLEHAIRANVSEMRSQYIRDTVGPDAADLQADVQAQLINPASTWSGLFVEFDSGEQLRPDLEARALVYQRMVFVYSIDEIRAMENKPPFGIKGVTDVPWAPSGMMPLTTAAKGKGGSGNAIHPQDESPAAYGEIAAKLEAILEQAQSSNGHSERLALT